MTTTTSDATAAGNTKNNQRRMKKDGLSSSGGSISLIESTPNGVAVGSSNNISSSNRAMPIKSVLKSSLQSMEQEQQQQYHLQQRMQQQQQEQQKTSTSRPTRMSNIYKWFEHKFRCCCLYCFRCNSGNHVRYRFYLQRFLNTSQWWKYVLIINTFILLFGSSVRDIFLPSNSDVFFNILFVITFVIFSIDILLRIYAEPHYFNYNFCGCRKHKNNHNELMDHNNNTTATTMTRGGGDESASGMFVNQSPSQRQTPIRTGDAMSSTNKNIASMTSVKAVRGSHMDLIGNRKRPGTSNEGTSSMVRNYNNYNQNVVVAGWGSNYFGFSLGSFLFWCDVLSTLTLLSEISWINPRKFKEQQIVILVDAVFGIPVRIFMFISWNNCFLCPTLFSHYHFASSFPKTKYYANRLLDIISIQVPMQSLKSIPLSC